MPEVLQGTSVSWYRNGVKEGKDPELGMIAKIHGTRRTVTIRLAAGNVVASVRHIDDPKLRLSVDQREFGAWDFTPEFKRQEREKLEFNQRITRLESLIEEKLKAKTPPRTAKKKPAEQVAG